MAGVQPSVHGNHMDFPHVPLHSGSSFWPLGRLILRLQDAHRGVSACTGQGLQWRRNGKNCLLLSLQPVESRLKRSDLLLFLSCRSATTNKAYQQANSCQCFPGPACAQLSGSGENLERKDICNMSISLPAGTGNWWQWHSRNFPSIYSFGGKIQNGFWAPAKSGIYAPIRMRAGKGDATCWICPAPSGMHGSCLWVRPVGTTMPNLTLNEEPIGRVTGRLAVESELYAN